MSKHFPRQDAKLRGKLRMAAREMRREPTPAEDALWQRLRGSQLAGYKFTRQHPIDRFIVDFYCASAALVIEVDGEIHLQQAADDRERDQILANLGFHCLRFTNRQVLYEADQVLQQILAFLTASQPE